MSHVAAHMTLSLDGFGAGPNQSEANPLGEGGEELHRWMFEDADNNREVIDNICNFGAFIMGRNMFGPIRGQWTGEWNGWWGAHPPYHGPVFVLTHHAREPLPMEGGTTFFFVTEGPQAALERAREAGGARGVSIAGGVSTLRHYLNTGAVDTLHLQIAPLVLGRGERLWDGLTAKLEPTGSRHTRFANHVDYRVHKAG